VPVVAADWHSLFWTVAGISLFVVCLRALLPESEVFLHAKVVEHAGGLDTSTKTRVSFKETKEMIKLHWMVCIYGILRVMGASSQFSC
jgi:MFS transporter, SHS family, lactate transporter